MKTLPQAIQNIIKALQRPKQVLNNDLLIEIINNANISKEELLKYSTFDHCKTESYGRNTLYLNDNFGIYVMSWSQGDFTGIHGHGHSEWGVVYFLGDADHRTYKVEGNKVELDVAEVIKEGSAAPVCGDLVHAMGNLSQKPFITLHIYGSNSYKGTITEDSQLYEIEKNRIRTTLGPAYLNISDELCKKSKQGILTDEKTNSDFYSLIQQFYKRNNINI